MADEPTEESQAKLEEVTNYTDEYLKDVQEQLTSYKAKLDKKADEKAKADADAKEKEVLEAKPVVEEEKKSSGMGALLIGGVLLVATLGAVNIMRKK